MTVPPPCLSLEQCVETVNKFLQPAEVFHKVYKGPRKKEGPGSPMGEVGMWGREAP